MKDYSLALMQGDALPAAERRRIAEQLAAFTGLPVDYVLEQDLRINIFRFVTELRRSEHRTIGRLDSRFVGITDSNEGFFDPSLEAINGGYTTALTGKWLNGYGALDEHGEIPTGFDTWNGLLDVSAGVTWTTLNVPTIHDTPSVWIDGTVIVVGNDRGELYRQ